MEPEKPERIYGTSKCIFFITKAQITCWEKAAKHGLYQATVLLTKKENDLWLDVKVNIRTGNNAAEKKKIIPEEL